METDTIRALVHDALLNWDRSDGWSTQGLGMLRRYLTPNVRLHIWTPDARVQNVSDMHDHPWNFTSWIISGRLTDIRYREGDDGPGALHMSRVRIKCGEGAGTVSDPVPVFMHETRRETLSTGQRYYQRADAVHVSRPEPGTVTIIERVPQKDVDHANVYFPRGELWVDAEPRAATDAEIDRAVSLAFRHWNVRR